jgi:hypothetical protein
MTRNQQMSSYHAYLEVFAPPRLSGLESSLRPRADFTEMG